MEIINENNAQINTQGKSRILWMDILNITACLCVIMLHCNHDVKEYYPEPSLRWFYGLGIYSICLWPVPVFLMLSFCNLINYKTSTAQFYNKRFFRIGIPFIVWNIIYSIFRIFYFHDHFPIDNYIFRFINGRFNQNMWFFIPLFGIYLCIPFLRILIQNITTKKLLYFILFAFLFNSFLPWALDLCYIPFPKEFFPMGCGYILVCLLGYLINNNQLSQKVTLIIYIAGLLMILFHYFIMYSRTMNDCKFYMRELDYRFPPSIIIPIAIFTLFKNINWEQILNKIHINAEFITQASKYSFSIYLLHWGVQVVGNDCGLPCLNRYYGFVITYCISFSIIYFLKRIPYVKYLIP